MRHDFDQLSPFDFEQVVRDLLRAEWRVPLETFTEGRDGGIDIRYIGGAGGGDDVIVQCKKLKTNAYARLKSELVTQELPKVKKLNPGRYVIATSVELNPARKDELVELLRPWVKDASDILGRDDLNGRLRDHPVRKAHIRLWLANTDVLEHILHSDIYQRSHRFRTDVDKLRSTYVVTSSYAEVRRRLANLHVCIISGDPGIGKTTLATMVAVAYLDQSDWAVFPIYNDIAEADRVWDGNRKQLFYYDDFLGRVALAGTSLAKNEDRLLLDLIAAVGRDSSKRLLLTTREYILAAARLRHDRLSDQQIDIHKYVIEPNSYSRWQRALILYNHLYMSPLEEAAKFAFIDSRRYLTVVSHPNYSPRLIDHITTSPQAKEVSAEDFPAFALRVLNNPEELWLHVLDNDIDVQGRAILWSLVSFPAAVDVDDLETAAESNLVLNPVSPTLEFKHAIRVLEGANLIRITLKDGRTTVTFRDASVLDFLINQLADRRQDSLRLIRSAVFFEQCTTLLDYSEGVLAAQSSIRQRQSLVPLKFDLEPMVLALCRTLWQPQSRTDETHSSRMFEQRDSVCHRLRIIITYAERAGTDGALNACSEAILSTLDYVGTDDLTPERLVKLFAATTAVAATIRAALDRLVARVADLLLAQLGTPESYFRALNLVAEWPGLFTDATWYTVKTRFGQSVTNWTSKGVSIAHSWQAEEVVQWIMTSGQRLGVYVGDCILTLRARWDRAFPPHDSYDYDRYDNDDRDYDDHGGGEDEERDDYDDWRDEVDGDVDADEDAEIEDLFDSLR